MMCSSKQKGLTEIYAEKNSKEGLVLLSITKSRCKQMLLANFFFLASSRKLLSAFKLALSNKHQCNVLKRQFPLHLSVATIFTPGLKTAKSVGKKKKKKNASSSLTSTRDNAVQPLAPRLLLCLPSRTSRDRPPCCNRSLDFTPPMFNTNHPTTAVKHIMQT